MPSAALRLHRWSDRAIVAVAIMALASGFGQFGVVAALGDVSTQLGHVAPGGSIADKVGLSGTSLGRRAGRHPARLARQPATHRHRRPSRPAPVILGVTMAGLALTAAAAASPGYWWFVVIFAFGRPLLSATNALAEVMAAEETGRTRPHGRHRAHRGAATPQVPGSRPSCTALRPGHSAFAGSSRLPSCPSPSCTRCGAGSRSPAGFIVAEAAADHPTPVLGAVGPRYRRRVAILCLIGFAISIVTGPANSFVFLYAQDVLHLAGYVTALMVVAAGISGGLGPAGGPLAGGPRSAGGRRAASPWSPSR